MAAPQRDILKDLYAEQVNLRLIGKQKDALEILDKMISQQLGQQYDLVREKAHCLYEMGETRDYLEQAIAQYKLAVDLYPAYKDLTQQQKIDLSNTYVGQARAYSQLGNQEEALILLKKAKEVSQDNKDRCAIEKALVYYKQQKLAEAQDLLLLVAQSPNQKVKQEAYYRLGFISENPKQQLDFYLKADQDDHVILFNIGNCYMRLYNFSAAIEKYTFALQIKRDPKYVYNLAKCFEINGQYEEAIETYMKALTPEWYSKVADIIHNLHNFAQDPALKEKHETQKASDKNWLVETTPEKELKSLFSIGNCFLHMKLYEQAQNLYDEVLGSSLTITEKPLILFNKGICLYQNSKLEEAYKCYEQSLELNPSLKSNYFQMGNIKVDQKNFEIAKKLFLASLKLDDNGRLIEREHIYNAKVKSNLGLCWQKLKNTEEAEKCLNEAYQLDPQNYQILCNLGVLKIKQHNAEEAGRLFKQALEVQKESQLPDSQRADNFVAIGSLNRISDMMKRFPKTLNEDSRKMVMSIVSTDQRGSTQEKTDRDVLERVLELIDVSRKAQKSVEEIKQNQEIIQKSVNKLEQEISKLQKHQQEMDKNYDDLKKLFQEFEKKEQQQPKEIQESEYDKLKKEEMNEVAEIYQDEFLTEYYYGMIQGFEEVYDIAKSTKLNGVFDIQLKKSSVVNLASQALKFLPFVGGFLSEKVKDFEQVFKERSLETKAAIMFDFFPQMLIYNVFSSYVSRKITLKMKPIKDEFLKSLHPEEQKKQGIVEKCKGLFKWISDKVSSVKQSILTFATSIPDYEQSEIRILAKSEVSQAFIYFFKFAMGEAKKKNQKSMVSTLIHPTKISTFFIFILEQTNKRGDFTQKDDSQQETEEEGVENIQLTFQNSEAYKDIQAKLQALLPNNKN
ncbi:hypothetical protein ABPG72_009422 [Tetrahymena utriculariae]